MDADSNMLKLLLYKFKRPYHLIKTGLLKGWTAQHRYHHPERQLQIIMVTGTDGKTTTATLLHHILIQANFSVGLITTVSAKIGKEDIETGLHVTAPQPDQLYQLLRRMIDEGCTHVVLEMTSHGGYQARQWGITPQLGIITNITPEHLDYHITFNEYAKAKASLFKNCPKVIVNQEVAKLDVVKQMLSSQQLLLAPKVSTLSSEIKKAIQQRFPENYNQSNAVVCWTAARQLGIRLPQFTKAIASFEDVPGRMNRLKLSTKYSIIIDFAHTSAGVKAVLTTLRQQLKATGKTGRIISVLGCAGLRDSRKRPVMGRIASKLSDVTIFTAEDPRTEDVWSIIRQMKEQMTEHHDRVVSIADRGEAIHFALTKTAKPNDVVIILGKGHEQSMCLGQTEHPWSDEEAVKAVINQKIVPRVGLWQPPAVGSPSP